MPSPANKDALDEARRSPIDRIDRHASQVIVRRIIGLGRAGADLPPVLPEG